jgi:chemotaxis protein histidine kinase CheA
MTDDIFADRVAKVRQRFVATLEAKIEETSAALPKLGGVASADTAAAAVSEAYRAMHAIVGIGRTVGFPDTGRAAHEVEDVLRPPHQACRGLSDDEISHLKDSLQALRTIAARELQSFQALSQCQSLSQ